MEALHGQRDEACSGAVSARRSVSRHGLAVSRSVISRLRHIVPGLLARCALGCFWGRVLRSCQVGAALGHAQQAWWGTRWYRPARHRP